MLKIFCFLLLCTWSISALSADKVRVLALFPNKAMLEIDGKRKVLSVGKKAYRGVKLLSANTKNAVVLLNGNQETLSIGSSINASFKAPSVKEIRIPSDGSGHYFTDGSINGQSVRFLLDTGATVVALSEREAKRIGLSYKNGRTASYGTASGMAQGREIRIARLSIAGLDLNDVKAVVLPGNAPHNILLGMSALGRLDWSKKGSLFVLKAKY